MSEQSEDRAIDEAAGRAVEDLSEAQAKDELARLAKTLAEANTAYHTHDAPGMSDAEYDALKARNAAIEARFPALKREDSPSDRVGAAPAEGFAKVRHAQRMLSLGNAFSTDGCHRIRCAYPALPGPR